MVNCSWMWNSIDGADASNVDEVGLVGCIHCNNSSIRELYH